MQAIERFLKYFTAEKFNASQSLPAILNYFQTCVNGVIMDCWRKIRQVQLEQMDEEYEREILDDGPSVEALLSATRGYEGRVTFRFNSEPTSTDVTLESFMDWAKYDVVHVSTHGKRIECEVGACRATLVAGLATPRAGQSAPRAAEVRPPPGAPSRRDPESLPVSAPYRHAGRDQQQDQSDQAHGLRLQRRRVLLPQDPGGLPRSWVKNQKKGRLRRAAPSIATNDQNFTRNDPYAKRPSMS